MHSKYANFIASTLLESEKYRSCDLSFPVAMNEGDSSKKQTEIQNEVFYSRLINALKIWHYAGVKL